MVNTSKQIHITALFLD